MKKGASANSFTTFLERLPARQDVANITRSGSSGEARNQARPIPEHRDGFTVTGARVTPSDSFRLVKLVAQAGELPFPELAAQSGMNFGEFSEAFQRLCSAELLLLSKNNAGQEVIVLTQKGQALVPRTAFDDKLP